MKQDQIWDEIRTKTNEWLEQEKILNGIANTPADEEMYDDVLKKVLDVTKSKYGIFGYIDEAGVFVCPSLTRGIWKECEVVGKDIVFPPETWGDSIWGRAIREKKTLYANTPLKVPDGHVPISRALMVPIIYHKTVIGLFEVANKEEDYTEKDIELLEVIADKIAPVLKGRLRQQRMEDELAELRQQVVRLSGGGQCPNAK